LQIRASRGENGPNEKDFQSIIDNIGNDSTGAKSTLYVDQKFDNEN
jgi:hypothetical protein